MDLSKSFEFFDPSLITGKCHIIGCGSVGSCLAELLARAGVLNFVLYDMDIVEAHNIANQKFTQADVGKKKTEAVKEMIVSINPEASGFIEVQDAYINQPLNGHVFLCVDNIDLRRDICKKNKFNRAIETVFDFRTELMQAQHYAAVWGDMRVINNLIATMDYTHDEAKENAPRTACGRELGVAATVQAIVCFGVANFINYIKNKETSVDPELKSAMVVNPFNCKVYQM